MQTCKKWMNDGTGLENESDGSNLQIYKPPAKYSCKICYGVMGLWLWLWLWGFSIRDVLREGYKVRKKIIVWKFPNLGLTPLPPEVWKNTTYFF